MMRYLFIDTDNYIPCALLTESGHNPQTIDQLKDLLTYKKIKLLLPEIVEIEFFRKLDSELLNIERSVKKLIDNMKRNFPSYLKIDKDSFIRAAQRRLKKRQESAETVKATIKTLFQNENVIKIPLSNEIFLKAYKRVLAGKKPYKHNPESHDLTYVINADCMIFESILLKANELKIENLVFCSNNHKDFATPDEKNIHKHHFHPELIASFPKNLKLKYYRFLPEALNAEFQSKIDYIEIKKARDYQDHIGEVSMPWSRGHMTSIMAFLNQLQTRNQEVYKSIVAMLAGQTKSIVDAAKSFPLTRLEGLKKEYQATLVQMLSNVNNQIFEFEENKDNDKNSMEDNKKKKGS